MPYKAVRRRLSKILILLGFAASVVLAASQRLHAQGGASANYGGVWSPDGKYIAYISERGVDEIYIVRPDGTGAMNLTKGMGPNSHPVWSPDSKHIAFVSRRDDNSEIYVIDVDGSHLLNLTNNAAEDTALAWSPDGKQIAFVSTREHGGIYLMDADGSNSRNLAQHAAEETELAWSPDGKQIAFVSQTDGEIDVVNADGSNVHALITIKGQLAYPAWSPDGRRLAYVAGNPENTAWTLQIATIGKGSATYTVEMRWSIAPDAPSWSPDGAYLTTDTVSGMQAQIWLINASSLYAMNLTPDDAQNISPHWSPNGRQIVFTSTRTGIYDIYIMDRNGKHLFNVTEKVS